MKHITLLNKNVVQNPNPIQACSSWSTDICGTDPDGCGAWSKDCCSVSDGGACGIGSFDCTDADGKD